MLFKRNRKKVFRKQLLAELSKLTIHYLFGILKINTKVKCRGCETNIAVTNCVYEAIIENTDKSANDYWEKFVINSIGAGLWIGYCCWYGDVYDSGTLIKNMPENIKTIVDQVKEDKMFLMFAFYLSILIKNQMTDKKEIENFSKKVVQLAQNNSISEKDFFNELYVCGLILYWSGKEMK